MGPKIQNYVKCIWKWDEHKPSKDNFLKFINGDEVGNFLMFVPYIEVLIWYVIGYNSDSVTSQISEYLVTQVFILTLSERYHVTFHASSIYMW